MYINLEVLLNQLKQSYHVKYGSTFNRRIEALRLVEESEIADCTEPTTLYILRLRSLRQLPSCPKNALFLCVVNPDSLAMPQGDTYLSGANTGRIILVYATRLDDVLIKLTEICYRCGRQTSEMGDLSRELLQCGDIAEVLAVAAGYLHNPLVVTDSYYRILAATPPEQVGAALYAELCDREDFLHGQADARAILSAVEQSMLRSYPVFGRSDTPFACRALYTGKRFEGVVFLLGITSELSEEAAAILELVGHFIHLVVKEALGKGAAAETDALGRLMSHIIDDADYSRDQLERELEQLGLRLKKYHYFISVQPAEAVPALRAPIHDLLHLLPALVPNTLGSYYNNQFILMVDTDTELTDISAAWPELQDYLGKNGLRGGVSNACRDILYLKDYYFQSQRAAVLGNRLFPNRALVPYYLCAPYHMLELAATYEDPIHFCDPGILRLYRIDRENNTELLHTLEEYLLSGHNKTQTAQRLFIHLNTVKYRLNQINEVISLHSLTTEDEVRLQLSLMALRYVNADTAMEQKRLETT